MLYVNFIKDNEVLFSIGFAMPDTEKHRKILMDKIKTRSIPMPNIYDNFIFDNKNRMEKK